VEENLRLGGLVRRDRDRGRGLAEAADRVYALFKPLAERRRRPAQTLSGGERQMLAIGRALMSRPRVLLLDEPSLGLAPRITAEIMAVIRGLRDSENLTVLLVEQNARSALSIADRAIVLNVGRVVVDAPAGDLAADASLRHAYLGF
jgi:branched-chain amino acid transport system ATP-binding protein